MAVDLTKSIAIVTGSDQQQFGTAFAVHQDERGAFLVTCAHVIEDVGGVQGLRVNNCNAQLVSSETLKENYDLAILLVRENIDLPIFELSKKAEANLSFRSAGCYKYGEERLVREIRGSLKEPVQMLANIPSNRTLAWYLSLDSAYKIEPGYSGSPVLDEFDRVVAVMSHRQNRGESGLAISIETILAVWRDLPTSLFKDGSVTFSLNEQSLEPLMNCESELSAFQQIVWNRDRETQLIVIHGPSGMGKTRLLQEYQKIAKAHRLNEIFIQLGPQISVQRCLDEITYGIGIEHFATTNQIILDGQSDVGNRDKEIEWQRKLTRAFFTDLSNHRASPRTVLFFDQYEKSDRGFREWLTSIFLPGVRKQPLIVIVAGQEQLTDAPFSTKPKVFLLNGIPIDWFSRYAHHCRAKMSSHDVNLIHQVLRGCPKQFVEFVQMQLSVRGG